jgi:hypothetical protein
MPVDNDVITTITMLSWRAQPTVERWDCRLTQNERAGDPVDLDQYRESGHLVLKGELGSIVVTVVITPYAQERMRRRDIDETEVLQALACSPSSHGRGKTQGRFEVAGMTDRGRVRVIYERPTRDIVLVITTHSEPD